MTDYFAISRITHYPAGVKAPTPDEVRPRLGKGRGAVCACWQERRGEQHVSPLLPSPRPILSQVFGGSEVSPVYAGPAFDELDDAVQNAW